MELKPDTNGEGSLFLRTQVFCSGERAVCADTLALHTEPGHVQRDRRPPQTVRVPACQSCSRRGDVHGVPAQQ